MQSLARSSSFKLRRGGGGGMEGFAVSEWVRVGGRGGRERRFQRL